MKGDLEMVFKFYARKPGRDWFKVSEEDAQFVHAMQRDFAVEASLSEHKFHLDVDAEFCWSSAQGSVQEYKVVREK